MDQDSNDINLSQTNKQKPSVFPFSSSIKSKDAEKRRFSAPKHTNKQSINVPSNSLPGSASNSPIIYSAQSSNNSVTFQLNNSKKIKNSNLSPEIFYSNSPIFSKKQQYLKDNSTKSSILSDVELKLFSKTSVRPGFPNNSSNKNCFKFDSEILSTHTSFANYKKINTNTIETDFSRLYEDSLLSMDPYKQISEFNTDQTPSSLSVLTQNTTTPSGFIEFEIKTKIAENITDNNLKSFCNHPTVYSQKNTFNAFKVNPLEIRNYSSKSLNLSSKEIKISNNVSNNTPSIIILNKDRIQDSTKSLNLEKNDITFLKNKSLFGLDKIKHILFPSSKSKKSSSDLINVFYFNSSTLSSQSNLFVKKNKHKLSHENFYLSKPFKRLKLSSFRFKFINPFTWENYSNKYLVKKKKRKNYKNLLDCIISGNKLSRLISTPANFCNNEIKQHSINSYNNPQKNFQKRYFSNILTHDKLQILSNDSSNINYYNQLQINTNSKHLDLHINNILINDYQQSKNYIQSQAKTILYNSQYVKSNSLFSALGIISSLNQPENINLKNLLTPYIGSDVSEFFAPYDSILSLSATYGGLNGNNSLVADYDAAQNWLKERNNKMFNSKNLKAFYNITGEFDSFRKTEISILRIDPSPKKYQVSINDDVYDFSAYFEYALLSKNSQNPVFNPSTSFMPNDLAMLIFNNKGEDITDSFFEIAINPIQTLFYIQRLFYRGSKHGTIIENHFEPESKYIHGSIKDDSNLLTNIDPEAQIDSGYVMIAVNIFNESIEMISSTLQSIARSTLPNNKSSLFIVVDSNKNILKEILRVVANVENANGVKMYGSQGHQFKSQKSRVNINLQKPSDSDNIDTESYVLASVYSGIYECGINRIPYVIVAKHSYQGHLDSLMLTTSLFRMQDMHFSADYKFSTNNDRTAGQSQKKHIEIQPFESQKSSQQLNLEIFDIFRSQKSALYTLNNTIFLEDELNFRYLDLGRPLYRFTYCVIIDAGIVIEKTALQHMVKKMDADHSIISLRGTVKLSMDRVSILNIIQSYSMHIRHKLKSNLSNIFGVPEFQDQSFAIYRVWYNEREALGSLELTTNLLEFTKPNIGNCHLWWQQGDFMLIFLLNKTFPNAKWKYSPFAVAWSKTPMSTTRLNSYEMQFYKTKIFLFMDLIGNFKLNIKFSLIAFWRYVRLLFRITITSLLYVIILTYFVLAQENNGFIALQLFIYIVITAAFYILSGRFRMFLFLLVYLLFGLPFYQIWIPISALFTMNRVWIHPDRIAAEESSAAQISDEE
ncbi:hypothetical protein BB561_005081 [Smittium simulii]|uniref:Chitin synthase n=1 Tax=Smittium simulii TaxID=133385 RepID=A0A2T9YCE6_9FUNG|nr:hypothetical protein BB561_005081 [Smittium simulii]